MDTLAHQEVLVNAKIVRLTLTICFPLITATGLWANQPASDNGESARMVVTAEPHKGAEAPAIKSADVTVNEGKEKDQVAAWIPA